MTFTVLLRIKSRDALVLYEVLLERFEGVGGKIDSTTFELIAATLSSRGILTAKDRAFTARTVQLRLAELEEIGVVVRETIQGGSFQLTFRPFPSARRGDDFAAQDVVEQVDLYGGRSLFDFETKTETETETVLDRVEEKRTLNKEIYINNKKLNKRVENENDEGTLEPVGLPDTLEDDRPDVASIRSRLPFDDAKIARLRAELVRRAWERSTNPDLIDRLVGLVVLRVGGLDARSVFGMISDAKEAVARYERTDGRAGKHTIWATLAYEAKRAYETAGWKWTPTRVGYEPRPETRESQDASRVRAAVRQAEEALA